VTPTVRQALEDRTELLSGIADWRDELAERIWRARLQVDVLGVDPDEFDELAREVKTFSRVCDELAKERWLSFDDEMQRAVA
jgi:hypothetical protein